MLHSGVQQGALKLQEDYHVGEHAILIARSTAMMAQVEVESHINTINEFEVSEARQRSVWVVKTPKTSRNIHHDLLFIHTTAGIVYPQ